MHAVLREMIYNAGREKDGICMAGQKKMVFLRASVDIYQILHDGGKIPDRFGISEEKTGGVLSFWKDLQGFRS